MHLKLILPLNNYMQNLTFMLRHRKKSRLLSTISMEILLILCYKNKHNYIHLQSVEIAAILSQFAFIIMKLNEFIFFLHC